MSTFRLKALSVVVLGLIVTACHQAASTTDVQRDVRKADQSALHDIVGAEHRKDTEIAAANADVAITRAESDHKVALAQCKSRDGDARTACRDQADAALTAAKANARAARTDAS